MRLLLDSNLLIYLNAMKDPRSAQKFQRYYAKLLDERCYIDPIIVDETLYVSKKKYNVDYDVTNHFLQMDVLPYVGVLGLNMGECETAMSLCELFGVKPSDAFHAAVARSNNISLIISEDHDFDRIEGLRRSWLGGDPIPL